MSYSFEDLPNEIFQEIFQYFDARMLYQIFYHLNHRFNQFIQSLCNLYLILSTSHSSTPIDDLFTSQIHTVIIHPNVKFTLSTYPNLRCVILHRPNSDQLSSMMKNGSDIEQIVLLSPRCFYSTYLIHEMIFSNQYPRLKSSHLTDVYSPSLQLRQISWSQTFALRSLRISSDDSLIHLAVLNTCPNLHSLQLVLSRLDPIPSNTPPHENLKKFKLLLMNSLEIFDEIVFESLFLFLPYLQQFTIQISINPSHFDHLTTIIKEKLIFLQYFRFILPQSSSNSIIDKLKTIFHQ